MSDERTTGKSCCCKPDTSPRDAGPGRPPETAEPTGQPRPTHEPWMEGMVTTPVGEIPRVSTTLTRVDRWGTWKARWGVRRMRFSVEPGLYAVGNPNPQSPVLVSANYKMSFDRLRWQLEGLDAWILVLDTDGINVWCAAGKGTFGTEELLKRLAAVRLGEVVSHRRLVVPQLGAVGVAAHQVVRRCGFRVMYGPVRAEDLPAFLAADMKATPEMRRVHFPLRDRVALIPLELVGWGGYALLVAACFLLLAGLGPGIYSVERVATAGVRSAGLFLAVSVLGPFLIPTLLPWLPGRSFSAKGAWLGLAMVAALAGFARAYPTLFANRLSAAAWILIIPALISFLAMNFTGASTYTSLSGVKREMRVAVPIQAVCAVIGAGLWLSGRFA